MRELQAYKQAAKNLNRTDKAPREVASLVLGNNRFINFVKLTKFTHKILKGTNVFFDKVCILLNFYGM